MAAAGNFDASRRATVINREDDLFLDSRNNQLYVPQSRALQEIIRRQTARVAILASSPRNEVKVSWANTSGITASGTCVNACDLGGSLISSDADTLTLTQCAQATTAKVEVEAGQDPAFVLAGGAIDQNELVAKIWLKQKKELEEKIAQTSLALTVGKAGTNQDLTPEYGTQAGTSLNIPAADWTPDLVPFFQIEAMLNRFGAPYMLHGRNLMLSYYNARPEALNDDQRDRLAKLNLLPAEWDPFTFAADGISNVSLMIDAGAIAFAARNRFTVLRADQTAPGRVIAERPMQQLDANTVGFAVPSISLPGVDFDVRVQRTCEDGRYFDSYEMKLPYYDILNNPANGIAGDTGVLKFTKVANA